MKLLSVGKSAVAVGFGLIMTIILTTPGGAQAASAPGSFSEFRTAFELDPPVGLTDLAQQLRPSNPRVVSFSHTGPSEGGFSNDGTLTFDEVIDRYHSDYRELRPDEGEPQIVSFVLEGRVEPSILGDLSSRIVQRQVFDVTKNPPLITTETRETTPTSDRTLAALAAVTMLAVTAAGCWMARARPL